VPEPPARIMPFMWVPSSFPIAKTKSGQKSCPVHGSMYKRDMNIVLNILKLSE